MNKKDKVRVKGLMAVISAIVATLILLKFADIGFFSFWNYVWDATQAILLTVILVAIAFALVLGMRAVISGRW